MRGFPDAAKPNDDQPVAPAPQSLSAASPMSFFPKEPLSEDLAALGREVCPAKMAPNLMTTVVRK